MCNILVSACLLGVNCRYNGITQPNREVMELLKRKDIHLIPACPEQLGGLSTPRTPAEITDDGRVKTKDGRDVTEEYRSGAREALRLAELYDCQVAILKERSPSCGHGKVYDGTFTGKLIKGNGVTASLLQKHDIEIYGESEVRQWERSAVSLNELHIRIRKTDTLS